MSIPARWQPYLFAAVACVCLAGFAGYDLLRERSRSVSQAKANTANLANLLEAHTRQHMRRVEAFLVDVVQRLEPDGAPRSDAAVLQLLRAEMASLAPVDRLLEGLAWSAAGGQSVVSTAPQEAPAIAADLRSDSARWLESPGSELRVARPRRTATGALVLPVTLRPVAGGRADHGELIALVNLGALQPVLDSVDTGRNGFITLFLTDGWMLATAPKNDALFDRNWFETPMFKQHVPRSRRDTVQQVVVRDGTERIYSYRALADFPLVVSAGISMTDALADWRARVNWDLLLLALACAGSGLGAAAISRTYGRLETAEFDSAEAREKAERSERFLREITDNLPVRIAYADRALRYRFVNRAHAEQFGLTRKDIVGRTREELTGRPLSPALRGHLDAVLTGLPQHFEVQEAQGNETRTIENHLIPDIDASGDTQGFYLASSDVTERLAQQRRIEEALAERETLLREVYHRVKNNLQVIQSLLSLQRRALPEGDARDALEESVRRIHAMALVHEKLYQTGNLQVVDLRSYTLDLLAHLGETTGARRRGVLLTADIEAVEATLETAVPYGLLVTELVGNSLKHGFASGRTGTVRIRLWREGETVEFAVMDDGPGLPAGFDLDRVASMGLQLAASLARQLGGTLRAGNDAGAVFSTPLDRLARGSDRGPQPSAPSIAKNPHALQPALGSISILAPVLRGP